MAGRQNSSGHPGGRSGWVVVAAWLTAALGLPSVVAVLKWRAVVTHPALAAGLIILGVLLLCAAALVRELWSQKYEIQVIDWISEGLDQRIARFGKRYRRHLLAELRLMDLKGTGVPLFTPALEEVYIEVALAPRDPVKVPPSDLPPDLSDLPPAGQRQPIGAFLGGQNRRVLAVLGAPGSGKTTLLRHTARQLCQHVEDRRIPVLLYLRDHITAILAEPQVALPELVAVSLARYGLTAPAGWLRQRLSAGDCIVMLDGLDEVARQEDRQAVSDWVGVQVTRYPKNDFIVTSRPLGYQTTPIEGAITLQTLPFTPQQISHFLHAWFQASGRYALGGGNQDTAPASKAASEADQLISQLQGYTELRPLVSNPLLLTMIATVHQRYGALPGTRAELYARICKALIYERQAAKRLKVEPSGRQKEHLMQALAYVMTSRKALFLPTSETIAILRPLLREMAGDLTPEEFLYDASANGLFVERGNGDWTFAHRTFQEYLTAAHIKARELQETLISAVNDVWWHETTLLYVAGTNAGPIVKACLAANTLPALTLAFDCASEAGVLSQELRNRLDTLLADGLAQDADPQRRALMIGVTVARHLRSVVETSNGNRLCRRPITAGIYQFFVEEMAARGQQLPPDAPVTTHPPADQVIAGVRGRDAEAFAEWVNAMTSSQPGYRLPTAAEIRDPAVLNALADKLDLAIHAVWLATDSPGHLPQLFCPDKVPAPWEISGSTIQQLLEADLDGSPNTLSTLPPTIHASISTTSVRSSGPESDRAVASAVDLVRNLDVADALYHAIEIEQDLNKGYANLPPKLHQSWYTQYFRMNSRNLIHVLTEVSACTERLVGGHERPYPRYETYDDYGDRGTELVPAAPDYDLELATADDLDSAVRVLHGDRLRTLAGARNLLIAEAGVRARDRAGDRSARADPYLYDLRRWRLQELLDRACFLALNIACHRASDLYHDITFRTYPGQGGSRGILVSSQDVDATCNFILGLALSQARISTMRSDQAAVSEPSHDLCHWSTAAFCNSAAIGTNHYAIRPDELTDGITTAITNLRARLDGSHLSSTEWARWAAGTFEALKDAIARRDHPIISPMTITPQILALCLAVESDARQAPQLSDSFRRIAAGITMLEQRHSGDDAPVEVIVLAES